MCDESSAWKLPACQKNNRDVQWVVLLLSSTDFEVLLKQENKSVLDLEKRNCTILQNSNTDHPNAFSWFLLFSQIVCASSRVFKNRESGQSLYYVFP